MVIKEKNIALQAIILVAAWASFFMLPFVFFPYNREHSPFESDRFVYSFISSNILLICFYYLIKAILIPSVLAKKQILFYILIVLACFLVYLAIIYQISINSEEAKKFMQSAFAKKTYYKRPFFFSPGPMTMFLLAFVVSSGSKVLNQWFTAEEIKEEITKQQLQTELSLLKSQVNPHFLFNTLNSIYSLSIANNKKTSDAVMKLSRIMRYTLEESQNDFVSLQQEIEFINSYIELQKIRLTDNVHIHFKNRGDTESVIIAPLLFIPFIENAFKYGISTHHSSTIDVQLKVAESKLTFICKNDCFPIALSKEEGTGTGIINTKRRLELLYNKRHDLSIKQCNNQFHVELTINLNV